MTQSTVTELEAVNTMLSCVGESPVNALESGQSPLADMAREILKQECRKVQQSGWNFNTEVNVTLAKNVDDEIPIGEDVVSVKLNGTSFNNPGCISVAIRGLKLYDTTNNTTEFQSNLQVDLIRLLDFSDVPPIVRWYIAVKAARVLQGRIEGSDAHHRFSLEEEMEAKRDAMAYDNRDGNPNMLRDSYSASRALLRRWDTW